MGLFQQREEDEKSQWTLPSEPLERNTADELDAAPAADPFALGLGDSLSSIVFPVARPAPAAQGVESAEPQD